MKPARNEIITPSTTARTARFMKNKLSEEGARPIQWNDERRPARSENLDWTGGQRFQKGTPVDFSYDPIVQDHDNAAIAFGADQTAHALTELQDRFRQGIFRESVPAAC